MTLLLLLLSISTAIFTLVCGFLITKAIKIYFLIEKYKNIPGLEPKCISEYFLGNILGLRKALKDGKCLSEYFFDQSQIYGNVFKLRFFDEVHLYVADPAVIKKTMIDEDFIKHPVVYNRVGFPFGERFMGNGVVTEVDRSRWRHKRAILNPAFQRKSLNSMFNKFNSKADDLMNYLKTMSDGKTKITLLHEFNKTALDVIAEVVFSMNLDTVHDRSNQLSEFIQISMEGLHFFLMDPLFHYNPFNWPYINKYKKTLRALRQIAYDEVAKRLEAIKRGDTLTNDLLTIILESNKIETLNVDEIVDDLVTLFIGGQETTASTLAFAIRELCQNPDVLNRLREEIDETIGLKVGIEKEDLVQLKYTNAVIKETMRLYPPGSSVVRFSDQEISTEEFIIPRNSLIRVSIFGVARTEEFFPEPLKFKPQRFMHDECEEKAQHSYTYFPFSLGPRTCIGQNFAQIEMKIVLAKFIQNFEFALDPETPLGIRESTLLFPQDGTKCFLKLRNRL